MTGQTELYKLLHDESVAESMGRILEQAGIPYEIRRSKKYFDPSFAFNAVDPEVNLLLAPEDFTRANHALKDFYASQTEQVDRNYYLLSFSDAELVDIIRKQDEWGSFDVALAKRLLHDRGIEIGSDTESAVERQRLQELARPVDAPVLMVVAGYVSVLAGGFFGIILGWLLCALKTLPDGSKMPVYTPANRLHGRIIMYAGITVFVAVMVCLMWLSYSH